MEAQYIAPCFYGSFEVMARS